MTTMRDLLAKAGVDVGQQTAIATAQALLKNGKGNPSGCVRAMANWLGEPTNAAALAYVARKHANLSELAHTFLTEIAGPDAKTSRAQPSTTSVGGFIRKLPAPPKPNAAVRKGMQQTRDYLTFTRVIPGRDIRNVRLFELDAFIKEHGGRVSAAVMIRARVAANTAPEHCVSQWLRDSELVKIIESATESKDAA